MNELYWIGGIFVIYLLMQLVILPKLGICYLNARSMRRRVPTSEKNSKLNG